MVDELRSALGRDGRGADGSWVRRQTRFFSSGSLVFFSAGAGGQTSGFWGGNARGGRAVSPGSDEIVPGWEAHLRHRGGPALDGAITPRVGVGRGLSHVSLLSENSSKRDRLMETPDRPRARLFARVNRPPHRRFVRYDDNRVRLSSRRAEWTIRASGEVHRHTTRRPPVLSTRLPPSVHTQHLDEEKASALVSRVCRSTVVSRAVYRRWVRPRVSPDPGLRARGYPRARRLAPRRNGTSPLRYRCAQPNLHPRRSASQADCRSPQSFFFPV